MALDVLIAEDEPSILESLEFILKRAGLSCSTVTDGDAALDAVRRLRPRVVVLDVMLPKRSGFEVLKQIRADALTSGQPQGPSATATVTAPFSLSQAKSVPQASFAAAK